MDSKSIHNVFKDINRIFPCHALVAIELNYVDGVAFSLDYLAFKIQDGEKVLFPLD